MQSALSAEAQARPRWPEARRTVRVSEETEIVVYSQGTGDVIVLLPSLGRGATDMLELAVPLCDAGLSGIATRAAWAWRQQRAAGEQDLARLGGRHCRRDPPRDGRAGLGGGPCARQLDRAHAGQRPPAWCAV
jgi:hypothetical protein